MGGVEGEIEEPGPAWLAPGVGEEVEGVIGEGVGRIEPVRRIGPLRPPRREPGVERVFLPEAVEPADHPVEVVEAAADRARDWRPRCHFPTINVR